MNKELEKIIKNNLLSIGSVKLDSNESIKYINDNLSLNAQSALINFYNNNLKNASVEEVAQAMKKYSKIEGNTFANAVYKLIQNASENQPRFDLENEKSVARPLTFKENMIARIKDNDLFNNYLDSCTGVAYKKGSSLIKLNPETKELITIPKDFNEASISIKYDNFEGEELDTGKTSKQDKWLIAMGGIDKENKEIYKDYQNILSKRTGVNKDNLMNFYTLNNPSKDQLRALCVYGDDDDSVASCSYDLGDCARLLRVD